MVTVGVPERSSTAVSLCLVRSVPLARLLPRTNPSVSPSRQNRSDSVERARVFIAIVTVTNGSKNGECSVVYLSAVPRVRLLQWY